MTASGSRKILESRDDTQDVLRRAISGMALDLKCSGLKRPTQLLNCFQVITIPIMFSVMPILFAQPAGSLADML